MGPLQDLLFQDNVLRWFFHNPSLIQPQKHVTSNYNKKILTDFRVQDQRLQTTVYGVKTNPDSTKQYRTTYITENLTTINSHDQPWLLFSYNRYVYHIWTAKNGAMKHSQTQSENHWKQASGSPASNLFAPQRLSCPKNLYIYITFTSQRNSFSRQLLLLTTKSP